MNDLSTARELSLLGDPLLRYFGGLFERATALDLVQETLLRVLQNVEGGRFDESRGSLRMYAYGVARLVRLEALKARRENRETDDDLAERSDERPGADVELARYEERMRLRRAFAHLSDVQTEILLLHLDRDMGLADIAGQLDLELNTVKSHIHRAKEKLRSVLEAERMTP